jgi:predicted transcriptional regulator YdeE
MKIQIIHRPKMILLGLETRTKTQDEFSPITAKILPIVQKYHAKGYADKIDNKANPGTLYSLYYDYESDHTGYYNYFIGEEVSEHVTPPDGMVKVIVPEQTYTMVTGNPGPLQMAEISVWQHIWAMNSEKLGGKRNFTYDLAVYDERAKNPLTAVVDVLVGITPVV